MDRFTSNRLIVFVMYTVLTVLALLSYLSTSLSVETLLPGLLLMWGCFFVYWIGARPGVVIKVTMPNKLMGLDSVILNDWKIVTLLAINAIVCSIAITRFYTAQTPVSVIQGLLGDASMYSKYQQYYRLHDLGKMAIVKYPYIAMNFLLNFITVYLYFGILLLYPGKKRWYHYLALIVCGVMYLYYGFARGTNFELFLFAFMNIYIIMRKSIRSRALHTATKERVHNTYGLLILAFLAVSAIVFIAVTNKRMTVGTRYYLSNEVYSDTGKVLSAIWPAAGIFIARLAQYFTWGLYYTSIFLSKIIFVDIHSFVNGLLPLGLSDGVAVYDQIAILIDPSSNWMPDVVAFWERFGLLGLSLLIYCLSILSKYLSNGKDTIHQIALYLICLQMFSLPIGNFVTILSANKLLAAVVLAILLFDALSRRHKWELIRD